MIIFRSMITRVDRNKYQIHLPLPPKIDPSVTMMQVEEKPDVTYSDVGGCKEQIEKLREVVELPLLHVRINDYDHYLIYFSNYFSSLKNSLIWVLNRRKVYYSTGHLVLAKPYVHELLPTGQRTCLTFKRKKK
jgi:hypothetical protein